MQLSQLKEIIQKYKDGTATPEERIIVEEWLSRGGVMEEGAVDITLEEKVVIGERILGKLREGIVGGVMRGSDGRVVQGVGDVAARGSDGGMAKPGIGDTGGAKARRFRILRVAVAAAAVILLAVVGVVLFREDRAQPVAMLSAHSGPYEIKHVVLPDSTVVALYHNSTITWPAVYSGIKREVRLTGQAYFDVYKNAAQAFVVHNGPLDIQVLGTSFIVEDQLEQSTIHLLTGKVAVDLDGRQLATLLPRQMIRYDKNSRIAKTGSFDAADVGDWLNKRLMFRETALADVWAAVGAQFNVKVNAPLSSGKVFTGDFTDKDGLKDILDVITISTGLKYHISSDSTISISK